MLITRVSEVIDMLQLIKRSGLLNNNDCIIFDFIVLGFLVNALLYVFNWLKLYTLFDMVNVYFWEYASAKAIGSLTLVVLLIIAASIFLRILEPVAVRFDKRLGAV